MEGRRETGTGRSSHTFFLFNVCIVNRKYVYFNFDPCIVSRDKKGKGEQNIGVLKKKRGPAVILRATNHRSISYQYCLVSLLILAAKARKGKVNKAKVG